MKPDFNYKCGEIYRYGPGSFVFFCQYCEGIFSTATEVADHIDTHFFPELYENKHKTFEPANTEINVIDSIGIYSANESETEDEGKKLINHVDRNLIQIENDTFIWPSKIEDDFDWPLSENDKLNDTFDGLNSLSQSTFVNYAEFDIFSKMKCSKKNVIKPDFDWQWPIVPIASKEVEKTIPIHQAITPIHRGSRLFPCHICGKVIRRDSYQNHVTNKHTEGYNFICDICNKAFKVKKKMQEHIRVIHLKIKPNRKNRPKPKSFFCDKCGKTLYSNALFKQHRHAVHGEGPFVETNKRYCCSVCKREFHAASNLSIHKRSHSDVRPFKCSVCGKSFKFKNECTQHTLLHSSEKKFLCRYCGKGFKISNYRNRHERSFHIKRNQLNSEVILTSNQKHEEITEMKTTN